MDQAGGSKKDCHIAKAQSQKLSAQAWVSFTSWKQDEEPPILWKCFVPSLWGLQNTFCAAGGRVRARQACVVKAYLMVWALMWSFLQERCGDAMSTCAFLSSLNPKCVLQCLSSSWSLPECRDWLYQVSVFVRWVKPKRVFTSNWNGQTKQSGQFWRAFQSTVLILFFGPLSSKALRHVLKVKFCA